MGNIEKQAVDNLIKGILRAVDEKISKISLTKYYSAEIIEVLDNGKYKIDIDNVQYTTYCNSDLTFSIHDKVWVVAPNGNFSRKFIEGRKK